MIVLAKIALGTAVVALALGAYVYFVQGEALGILAMAVAALVAALAAMLFAQAKKKKEPYDAG